MLLIPKAQDLFSRVMAGVGNTGHAIASTINLDGVGGQFILGLLLGLAWTPCVGPTLGLAIGLASNGENLTYVSMVMAFFGLGAAASILLASMASRRGIQHLRGGLGAWAHRGKQILGASMMLIGVLLLTGSDKWIEAQVINMSPEWLLQFSTSI